MPPTENCFEAGLRKVIPAVLVYLRRGSEILMIHRDSRGSAGRERLPDYHAGKWNGLGGKCEKDESPWEAARREVLEESGLELSVSQLKMLGVVQFPDFKAHKNEDWIVFVFVADLNAGPGSAMALPDESGVMGGEPLKACSEGSLHWVPAKDLLSLNLWPGDIHFIPFVLERKPFAGTIWYSEQVVVRYWIQGL